MKVVNKKWISDHINSYVNTNSDVSFGSQFLGTISIVFFVFVVSYIVWSIMKATIGIRISKEAERLGTDKSEVGVIAYGIRD